MNLFFAFRSRVKGVLLARRSREIVTNYMEIKGVRKLHVGANNRILDGWLNTDLTPSSGVAKLDATKPFPFADNSFDYILAEHMIEHIPHNEARHMLAECHRILRNDGVLRIVTPDLQKLAALYSTSSESGYVDWFCETFVPEGQPKTVGSVLNAHFSMWGHQFLYDETLLADAMKVAGFRSITRYEVGESALVALSDIENVRRYPEGFLKFESLTLEAVK